ncbi:MAG: flagellar biosynthesis protein FlgA [Thermoleophilia bacterium]|nr:flagellar biosynthesis protein FlgA [Thermoleophilia bacterium]
MSLLSLLRQREADGDPVRVGVIGAGTFSTAFLNQARQTPGMRVACIADIYPQKAHGACLATGWPAAALAGAASPGAVNDLVADGKVAIVDDADHLLNADLDVVVECTGLTGPGAYHAWTALDTGKHVVMVNVETDVLVGHVLQQKAASQGLVYSMAYGDQPAIISEMVDWARSAGFEVVCAGKGTRFQPEYRYSTPDTVWEHMGFTPQQVEAGGYSAQMYNSFLDTTKSAIEACAVCNANELLPQACGLQFPAIGPEALPTVLKPAAAGGILQHSGTVEIVASENRDGTPIENNLRWGVFVVFRAATPLVRRFFQMHDFLCDPSAEYGAFYRPFHMIGFELGISVASAALRGEPTGCTVSFTADVAATAKKDLKPGETLDGEGGHTVFGGLVRARESVSNRCLPIGLAHGVRVVKPVAKDSIVTYDDVVVDESSFVCRLRRQQESQLLGSPDRNN